MHEMGTEELAHLYEQLSVLHEERRDDEAKKFLVQQFNRLPDELRARIQLEMFTAGLEAEVAERETIEKVRSDGFAALEILQAVKEELEAQKKGETSA
jgi:hypothetical protein